MTSSGDNKRYVYQRLPPEQYDKAIGQLRLSCGVVLQVFDKYGMGVHIPGALDVIVELAEQFGMRIRGKEQIISPPAQFLDKYQPDD